jgi:23S rRNA (uridine2552-2'-O)-methyltransferase
MPQKRQLHDRFFRQAKSDGYVARSAYKLIEIDDKFHILRGTRSVIDLGCSPGSWLQVLERRCDPRTAILGVDLKPAEARLTSRVTTLVANVTTLEPEHLPVKGPFDLVLSDMAPNTTGAGDDLRSASLCRDVLRLCPALLRPGGALVMKILEGSETAPILHEARDAFDQARMFKPQSSRDVSRETFLVAQRYRPRATP